MAQFVTHIQPTLIEASQGHMPGHHHQVGISHSSHLPHSGHNMPSPPTAHHGHGHGHIHGQSSLVHSASREISNSKGSSQHKPPHHLPLSPKTDDHQSHHPQPHYQHVEGYYQHMPIQYYQHHQHHSGHHGHSHGQHHSSYRPPRPTMFDNGGAVVTRCGGRLYPSSKPAPAVGVSRYGIVLQPLQLCSRVGHHQDRKAVSGDKWTP
ncbi:hypothetical protein AND_004272 [Anopheles darlingi]|uniref:Uncharacterized protein n=1 Tax=Anopheles darlingi TaxID=43151 RepID=W5JM62_ANODA|nr:hypothetical protein AND_004272 [Anopheles darlingi]